MVTEDHASWGHTASTGLGFTHESIVDAHFEACLPHYRAALDQVGIRSNWHVLDAGCGSGAFLPWLADLVGPGGRVSAIDLAAENAELAAERMRRHPSRCAVDVRQGDVLGLPYEDDTFDAVWCANTTQYLDDDELACALRELSRVVRPGGIVVVKDLDASLITVRPADPFLLTDFFRHAARSSGYARQLLRTRDLHRYLDDVGLVSVRQRTMLIEHFAPLGPAALRFYTAACARIAQQATDRRLAGDWAPFLDPDGAANPLRDPQGYLSEGNTVTVGTVPPASDR
ncbi:class I SAM-dependent methyltransferase [Streptomyces sporangiiformans]|uniref:Class I SAM-dependent methyltransferase n=1 Tax=Streptomyces sporangiiformans TaxID=2315329 RepID=A0A505DKL4_9ACTN|nr:class I SAM-dependent methyltransferase [Streptomyces sporangiiformans]TPQ18601.1 class I SAM-dependent methyltransferase [Streptomyces sporangiiformans]